MNPVIAICPRADFIGPIQLPPFIPSCADAERGSGKRGRIEKTVRKNVSENRARLTGVFHLGYKYLIPRLLPYFLKPILHANAC
jgi:hypothetical protein